MNVQSPIPSLCAATGTALAGPAGGFIGNLVGQTAAALLPTPKDILSNVVGNISSDALFIAGTFVKNKLSVSERQRLNQDLQTAFGDACQEALFDLGGEQCFPNINFKIRNVPSQVVYPLTPEGNKLWRSGDPLAEQICQCLHDLKRHFANRIPLELSEHFTDGISWQNLPITHATSLRALATAFYEQLVKPALVKYDELKSEISGFFAHLRRFFFERILIHWEDAIKGKDRAWRAFNKWILEGLRDQLLEIGFEQETINEKLDSILDNQEKEDFISWSETINDIFSFLGNLEEHIDTRFDVIVSILTNQHVQLMNFIRTLLDEKMPMYSTTSRRIKISLRKGNSAVVQDIEIAIQGLSIILANIQDEVVHRTLLSSKKELLITFEQIELLERYKRLHDSLLLLRDKLQSFLVNMNHMKEDDYEVSVIDLIDTVEMITELMRDFEGMVEMSWYRLLEASRHDLEIWFETREPKDIERATGRLNHVMNIAPRHIDGKMRLTAERIQLALIAQQIGFLVPQIQNREYSSLLKSCSESLERLDETKKWLINEHDRWQYVYDQLRLVERGGSPSIQDLEIIWPEFLPAVNDLSKGHPEDWAKSLSEITYKLSQSIEKQEHSEIRRFFLRLNSRINKQFAAIDQQLLDYCQQLTRLVDRFSFLVEATNA